jgi:hypothetical protein
MTRKDFILIADHVGPLLSPQAHITVADALEETNPRFDREKFLKRAIKAWEDKHLAALNDEIPY